MKRELRWIIRARIVSLFLLLLPVSISAQTQTYAVDERTSLISFAAHSTGHDFQGETSKISGRFGVDRHHMGEAVFGDIHIAAASLHTGITARDTKMYQHLAIDQFPEIVLTVQRFLDVHTEAGNTYTGQLVGELSIKGVTKALPITLAVTFPESQTIHITGSTPLNMTDFGIDPPGFLLFRVDKQVQVHFRIVGKVQ